MADARAANKLTPHMDRVRSLELSDFPDPYKLVPLMRPAPALESLLVTTRTTKFDPQRSAREPPVLFADSAPSLRALALLNPYFLPLQDFAALTDLHISSLSEPHLWNLLDLLWGTPALESLAVTDLRIPVHHWVQGGGLPLFPPVPLERLRRLALVRTPLMRGIALLQHLSLPREATVHVLGLLDDSSIHRIVTPLPLLPQLPPVSAANALEMVVCGGTLAFRTRVLAADGSVASVSRAHCTAHWGTHTYDWWKGLSQALPCAQLTELRVAVDADDEETLPRFLQAAVALVTLELRLHPGDKGQSGESAPTHCLDGAPRALLGVCVLLEQEMPAVCPCLAELAIIDVSSSPRAWGGLLRAEGASPRVVYVPDLLRVIAARAMVGRGLRRVALQGLWSCAQRDRIASAFEVDAVVTKLEFRELDAETSPLFEFEEDREEIWANGHWTYELPKSTLPWAPANGSRRGVHAPVVKVLEIC
ncbi:hypothetical protein GSI_07860 [Ganoderma sinense ZZ0214-1]|uniref:F-box domain-containing protein n=1 Tax=Ganoderma sinense ZZ0214-1 TaxID=1077348 RepID=A0A2G8S845_9APHY|nr:hypothetical protein GSI_07860 [Ganoderma sinense ZZ0214-1]